MEAESQVEPIVSRDEIRCRAYDAADAQQAIHKANPYPPGSTAHRRFEIDCWARHRWLSGEESS